MPDTHRVILTADARADLDGIADYIRQHAPERAAAVADRILAAVDSLATLRSRFKVVGKSKRRGTPVHSLVVTPFVIYYRVEQASLSVQILTIRHGKRRQPRRFE